MRSTRRWMKRIRTKTMMRGGVMMMMRRTRIYEVVMKNQVYLNLWKNK